MKPLCFLWIILFFQLTASTLSFGQLATRRPPNSLLSLMETIQAKSQHYAAADPEIFRQEAARIADQQLDRIIHATKSEVSSERRLGASLLAIASPSTEGTARLVALTSDLVPDVRYAALLGLATVTDGTNKLANEAVVKALGESGNQSITRDAAFAASKLKLIDALPQMQRLLESEDSLDRFYGIDAAERYGIVALPLLPLLQRQINSTDDPFLKTKLEKAIASIENTSSSKTMRPINRPIHSLPPSADDKITESKKATELEKIDTNSFNKSFGNFQILTIAPFIIALVCIAYWLQKRKLKS
jgi:HEAT repeat protein